MEPFFNLLHCWLALDLRRGFCYQLIISQFFVSFWRRSHSSKLFCSFVFFEKAQISFTQCENETWKWPFSNTGTLQTQHTFTEKNKTEGFFEEKSQFLSCEASMWLWVASPGHIRLFWKMQTRKCNHNTVFSRCWCGSSVSFNCRLGVKSGSSV